MSRSDRAYVGLDNGTTASFGVLGMDCGMLFAKPPVFKRKDYHKTGKNITRISNPKFLAWLADIKLRAKAEGKTVLVVIEKPFTGMACTAVLAGRAYESELIAIEALELETITIFAAEWQGTKKVKGLLPYLPKVKGMKGSIATKKASMELGIALYPHLEKEITKHGDFDGGLIAHWAMQNNL